MTSKYIHKPSTGSLEKYKSKIEEFLSAFNLKISISLYDLPIHLYSSINNEPSEDIYLWIEKVVISTPKIKKLEVELFSQGIDGL